MMSSPADVAPRPDFHVPCIDSLIPVVPVVNVLRTPCDSLLAWCQLMDCIHAMFLSTSAMRPMTSYEMRHCYHTLRVLAAFFFDNQGRVRGGIPGAGGILGILPPRSDPIMYTQFGQALMETLGPAVVEESTGELPRHEDMARASMSNIPRTGLRVDPSRMSVPEMWKLVHEHCLGLSSSSVEERRKSISMAYTALFDPVSMARTVEILANNALAGPSLYVMFPWVFGVRRRDGSLNTRSSFYAHVPDVLSLSLARQLDERSNMDACGLKLGDLRDAFEERRAQEIKNILVVMGVFVAGAFAANVLLWKHAVDE